MSTKTAEQIVNESIAKIKADLDFIPMMHNVMPDDHAEINEIEHELRVELHAEVQFALDIM
jgi:hypothetical protein